MAGIDREIEKLIELALTSKGTMLTKINQRANDFEIQRNDLIDELTKLQMLNATPKTQADYVRLLSSFMDGDINDPEYRKRIIYGLVNTVWIGDGGMIIYLNTDSEKPLTIDDVKANLAENNVDFDQFLVSFSNRSGHAIGSRMTKAVYTHIMDSAENNYIASMNDKVIAQSTQEKSK